MKIKETEKRAKFVKFSNRRLKNAIQHIELIGKLANKRAYEYTGEDIQIIKNVLYGALIRTIDTLEIGKSERQVKKWIE